MATTATVRTAKFLPLSGGKVRKILVNDTQTLRINDFVILSGGRVSIAADDGSTASDVYGIVQDAVTNSAAGSTTYVNVRIIEPSSRFIGNYINGTTNTAVATPIATLVTAPGLRFRLQRVDKKWCLSAQTAASDTVGVAICTALANEDILGTAGGRLIFKISNHIIE